MAVGSGRTGTAGICKRSIDGKIVGRHRSGVGHIGSTTCKVCLQEERAPARPLPHRPGSPRDGNQPWTARFYCEGVMTHLLPRWRDPRNIRAVVGECQWIVSSVATTRL